MTLYQLKSFVTVARLGSFTQAAEALKVRQPSATLIVQSLERELEVKLFERLGNKIHLTNAGEELLREAEPIVARVEGIKERMDEVKGLRRGKISVGGSGLAGATFLPTAVQMFKKNHPAVEVTLTVERSRDLEKKLLDGGLDVAILSRPPQSPILAAESYLEDKIVAIASPNHPLTKKRSVPLGLLVQAPIISNKEKGLVRHMLETIFAERILPFAPLLEVSVPFGSRDAIRSAVANGLGIGFISESYTLSDVKAGRLKLLKVPELDLKRTIYIAFHRKREVSSLTRAFIDFLNDHKKTSKLQAMR